MLELVIQAIQIIQNEESYPSEAVTIECHKFENDYDHLVVRYDKNLRKLTTTIHPHFIVQIYNRLKSEFYSNLINSTVPLIQLIRGPVMKGLIFESIIIEIIMKRFTFLKVNIDGKIGSECSKTGLLMYFATDRTYPFESLPKANQKVQEYQFLQPFQKFYQKCEGWTVFLPVKRSIITNIKSHITDNQVDYSSKCIDFITSGYVNNLFLIVAWDVTISKFAVKEKLRKFWLEFNQFKDRFKKRLNENTQANLYYIILMNKKQITKDFSLAKILRQIDPNLASHYTFEETPQHALYRIIKKIVCQGKLQYWISMTQNFKAKTKPQFKHQLIIKNLLASCSKNLMSLPTLIEVKEKIRID